MKLTKRYISLLLIVLTLKGLSQTGTVFQPGDYRDGIYTKENSTNRRFIPYTFLREADVQWSKRVWRYIDLREKINQPLYYPLEYMSSRLSLIQVLQKALLNGDLIGFGSTDEEFLSPLTVSEIKKKFIRCDSATNQDVDAAGNPIETRVWRCDSGAAIFENVLRYKVKEDWFFDKQKSVLEVRILGLCPSEYMEDKGEYKDWFWVYFPACRPIFAKYEAYNTQNDAERRSFEDIFWKRLFNSYIYKEQNVYDRNINQYAQGIDALLESDRIKNDIFLYEHDMWHF